MSERRSQDSASLTLVVLGIVIGIVQIPVRPFLLGPVALLCTLIGVSMSGRYRRLGLVALVVIATFFVVGAAFTVWDTRPLY
jgi:hypothetical protein